MPLPAGIFACTTTALACSMVTEPVAVTTFPMALVSRTPAEGCAGLFCARATPGTIADSITAATNTAIACTRMAFHSLKVKVFINTLVLAELTHSVLAELTQTRTLGTISGFSTVPGIDDIAKLSRHLWLYTPQSIA